MKKIIVTCRLPGNALDRLSKKHKVHIHASRNEVMNDDELMHRIGNADAIITLLSNKIDERLLEAGKKLKIVSNYAVGYNNIDVNACTKRNIWVGHTPGVLTDTTADFGFALLLACARRVVEADRYVRENKFDGWYPDLLMGTDIHSKTIGVVGMGRIGQAMAKRANGFDMNVIYYDKEGDLGLQNAKYVDFEELLAKSDYVSLHVPLLDSTKHLINKEALARMKQSAILINTARGEVIDEAALVEALNNEVISGAGLDVYEAEPQVHPNLLALNNVVLAPHIASSSRETREEMANIAVENVIKVLNGEEPLHAVNKVKVEE